MNGLSHLQSDFSEFVEVDPTGRYGRYNDILGKGASKTVYRAFDEYEGIEVAWNQVKLYDFLQSPEDLERLYCEIHLLKTLKHSNIMKFYSSWVDIANRNINFVTELFTSGTLRQYRQKHKRVNIRAIKHWCRQILKGLLYLHSHDPPVIHRDLKCDNIFINGNQGEVKIGDLGLAAILRKSHADRCVGTPEFMAPEVYEEEYNELVDIYSFGMCILEMVTFEYPYSECSHPAQIYKKVITGKKPDALYKMRDKEVQRFIEKCLATVSLRLSARELLDDPFLQIDDCESDLRSMSSRQDFDDADTIIRQPFIDYQCSNNSSFCNGLSNGIDFGSHNDWDYHPVETERNGIELFEFHDDEHFLDVDVSIKGKIQSDGIFLRLRMADKEGRIRNIYFPFDLENDTALSVATEMVAELDITEQDVAKISDMIDGEISSLVPQWKPGSGLEETARLSNSVFCGNCGSNRTSSGSLMEYISKHPGEIPQCCIHGCAAATHGRFEEITFQAADGSEHHVTDGAPVISSHSEDSEYTGIWGHRNSDLSLDSRGILSDEECKILSASIISTKHDKEVAKRNKSTTREINAPRHLGTSRSSEEIYSPVCESADNFDVEIQQEFRWLKAKHRLELKELRDIQFGIRLESVNCSVGNNKAGIQLDNRVLCALQLKSCTDSENSRARNFDAGKESAGHGDLPSSNTLYSCIFLPQSLHRTMSLPVDAVNV